MEILNLELNNHIAYLTIQSPPANALSSNLLQELELKLDRIEEENTAKVVVIKGEGKFFSAGADIKEFTSLQEATGYQSFSEKGQNVFHRLENLSIPVIAAIHGAALGGGLELAMSCHMRIVTENAKLGLPELTLGIIPGYGGTQRLPRYVGNAKAYEMILTGTPISGNDAFSLGLVNKVVTEDALVNETNNLAKKIASMSKPSINEIMHLLSLSRDEQLERGVKEEAISFGRVFASEDAKEGVQAFIEKRKPNFRDK
ncbi:enoyl-CoA hydratase [Oceanobacillus halophilus]|uniref:Enoyl-CoA hydratase n=1 Tax=Oceanobacillus halophilus TaxID=930130 RepID=A0A495AD93_9BACI|nr:enoyl-CoA hydratase [Oceanobacillus halophilus]RKQ37947.1 enoyl-CoA hydratase [Oceanobacillus halophilus]